MYFSFPGTSFVHTDRVLRFSLVALGQSIQKFRKSIPKCVCVCEMKDFPEKNGKEQKKMFYHFIF